MTDPIDQLIAGQPDILAEKLRTLATKEDGYGMSYEARYGASPSLLRLFGKRADAAYWLLQHGAEIADALDAKPTRETVTIEKRTEGEWREFFCHAQPNSWNANLIFSKIKSLGLVLPENPRPITTRMLAAGFTEEEIAAVGKENEK